MIKESDYIFKDIIFHFVKDTNSYGTIIQHVIFKKYLNEINYLKKLEVKI
jgi:hypothetical protein